MQITCNTVFFDAYLAERKKSFCDTARAKACASCARAVPFIPEPDDSNQLKHYHNIGNNHSDDISIHSIGRHIKPDGSNTNRASREVAG